MAIPSGRGSARSAQACGASTATLGAVMALAPDRVGRQVAGTGARPDPRVVRVLGLRQLVQGVLVAWRPTRRVLVLGAGVDAAHAASMVALAALAPRHRRPALASALAASVSSTWGLAAARAAGPPS